MRQAVEAARMGWGLCTVTGVAGKGETLDVVPRLLITGRRIAGSSFGGVKGRDQVPVFVERYLDGEIDVDAADLPPPDPGRGQPRLRADARPGRHPQRDRLRPMSTPTVLALHGITSTGRAWDAVARELDGDARVLAPDQRGRGDAGSLPGPYGIDRHAEDAVDLLDREGVDRAVVAGHSMGAYVAARLAAEHPDRVQALVLVDGGLPLPVPEDADPDALLDATLGPAIERLSATFPDLEAHRAFWRRHPAFAGPEVRDEDLAGWADHDLTGRAARAALRRARGGGPGRTGAT